MIWNLLLAGFLIWLGNHRKIKPPGLFALYVAGYSGYRIFEETIRIDYSKHILGMRLNFWIATLLCLAGLAWFVLIQRRGNTIRGRWTVPRADARAVRRASASTGYRKPPATTYGRSPRQELAQAAVLERRALGQAVARADRLDLLPTGRC